MTPRLRSALFDRYPDRIHSWCVVAAMCVLGIGGFLVLFAVLVILA